jgi:hypothetical protein
VFPNVSLSSVYESYGLQIRSKVAPRKRAAEQEDCRIVIVVIEGRDTVIEIVEAARPRAHNQREHKQHGSTDFVHISHRPR